MIDGYDATPVRTPKSAGLFLALALSSCATAPHATDPRTSRIIVHSSMATPVGIRARPALAIAHGRPGSVGTPGSSQPVTRVDRFPHTLRCELGTLCVVQVRNRLGALVFAFDPKVEIAVEVPADPDIHAVPRYLDRTSTSAALGEVLTRSTALHAACDSSDVGAATLESELLDTATKERRRIVRDSAALALVESQCSNAVESRALARRLLRELDPASPALALWTDALLELGNLAGDKPSADAFVERVVERHPNAEVGARLLLVRLHAAIQRGDDATVATLEARLRAPPFAKTGAAVVASMLQENLDNLRVAPGDPLPALELGLLAGGTLEVDDARPLLVYFSASWCTACATALPVLRRLAREHPELQIAYVLWDEREKATAFVQRRAPLPGAIVLADERTRALLLARIVEFPVFPSFVLAGPDGHVLATSHERELDELGALLSPPAP